MGGLGIIALGVGDAFSARHYSTCIALRGGERWFLIDCPHPIRKMMHEASQGGVALDVGTFDAFGVTHLHADHASGLECVGFFSRFVLGRRPRLVAHPDVLARLWANHLAAGMDSLAWPPGHGKEAGLEDFFEVVTLDASSTVRVGPFAIECRRTRHPVPTTALRVEAEGRRVAYSSDTEFDPELIAWLGEADLVLHETGRGLHTPLERLAELPDTLRRRMRLVHYPDDLDPSGCPIEPLEQGRIYAVP